jgi:hypothetical protein
MEAQIYSGPSYGSQRMIRFGMREYRRLDTTPTSDLEVQSVLGR